MQQVATRHPRGESPIFGVTQISYYRARYYDPAAGRFLSEDPIGFGGGSDFYEYVLNSPTDYTDPAGLKTSVCCRRLHYVFGYLGLNHCYVKISQDGGPPHTYGLHREGSNGVLFPDGARPLKDDPTDTGGTCQDVPDATPCKEAGGGPLTEGRCLGAGPFGFVRVRV